MRSSIAKSSAVASFLLGITAQAVPVVEADEAVNVYDVFPVEVVIAKPTAIELFCPENGIYPLDDDLVFTVTNAPTTIATQTTRYSTLQTQTTVYRDECQQEATYTFAAGAMPWGDTCLPPTGANITLPPSGDRKIPLTIAIPVQSDGVCGSQPVATQESKYQTVATDYSGPCSTITNLGYAGSTPTTYRFPPGPDETLGLEVICKPGSPRPHSCGACVTYTKIVEGLPMPITISIPPTGTQTDGSVIVITPPPVPDADGDGTVTVIQPLPTGTDAITTTLQPGSPGDPTTVIVLEPTDALPGVTTITRPGTSTVPITSTILPAPGSGGTTSVIIVEPTSVPGGTVTVTTIVPGGPGFTTTLTATDPSEPDTVIIGTTAPAATITITSVITDDSPAFTTTIMATDPDDQDTVIIGIPTSDPAPTVTPDTTTFTVPIPAGSSYETTITATDDGPDNVIIGSPAPEEPNTDRDREFPTLPGLPPPDETGITNVPAETPDTTTENTITPTFVFRSDTTTAATEPTDGGETEDGETATPTPTGNPEEGESGEGGEGGEGGATGIDATPGPSETAPLADTFCDNIGFRYAMIPHNYYNSDAPTYSNVDVVGLRESRPVYVGQARKIGFPPYPGAPDFNLEYMAINHEAWINAVIAGEYTFELPFVDDIAFVWVGTDAYSGWTRENADAVLGIFGGSATLSVTLEAGVHLAIRVLFVNGQGGYFLRVTIRNPNGDIIADADGVDEAYIVQDTCGDFAPNFPSQLDPLEPPELILL